MFILPVEGYGYFLESAKELYRHEIFLTYYDKIRYYDKNRYVQM